MRLWMALLAVIPACGFGSSNSNDAGNGAEMPVPPDARQCFGSFVKVCFDSADHVPTMTSSPVPAGSMIDTDSITMCDQNNDQMTKYCVLAGGDFTVAADKVLRAYGSKPLVLLSTGHLELHGTIDVSSTTVTSDTSMMMKGAGHDPASLCPAGSLVKENSGGYGGSFQGHGGDGERKDTAEIPTAPPEMTQIPTTLRGGCPGATGSATDLPTGGAGGSGGGAVAIIATTLHVDGTINASGAGGAGGPGILKCGGGGGGSGGMIVFDVPSATALVRDGSGSLFANGGGGGEGGASNGAGQAGKVSNAPAAPAAGGDGGKDGGNGGPGSSGSSLNGGNAVGQSMGGGGGGAGGGGAGFIHAPGITATASIAPPST